MSLGATDRARCRPVPGATAGLVRVPARRMAKGSLTSESADRHAVPALVSAWSRAASKQQKRDEKAGSALFSLDHVMTLPAWAEHGSQGGVRGLAESSAEDARWRMSTFSANVNCVELATVDSRIVVRDSKDRQGPRLTFTAAEWLAFVQGVKAGQFDLNGQGEFGAIG